MNTLIINEKFAHSALAGSNIFVKEQFPKEIETEIKRLYGPAKEAWKNPENRVHLVKDTLYINGKRFCTIKQTK